VAFGCERVFSGPRWCIGICGGRRRRRRRRRLPLRWQEIAEQRAAVDAKVTVDSVEVEATLRPDGRAAYVRVTLQGVGVERTVLRNLALASQGHWFLATPDPLRDEPDPRAEVAKYHDRTAATPSAGEAKGRGCWFGATRPDGDPGRAVLTISSSRRSGSVRRSLPTRFRCSHQWSRDESALASSSVGDRTKRLRPSGNRWNSHRGPRGHANHDQGETGGGVKCPSRRRQPKRTLSPWCS